VANSTIALEINLCARSFSMVPTHHCRHYAQLLVLEFCPAVATTRSIDVSR
jgi:hypothetical protein